MTQVVDVLLDPKAVTQIAMTQTPSDEAGGTAAQRPSGQEQSTSGHFGPPLLGTSGQQIQSALSETDRPCERYPFLRWVAGEGEAEEVGVTNQP
eukprot:1183741-Prorocentrum_minimum.AAC.1